MKSPIQRIDFDPSNTVHRFAFREFLQNGRWVMHFNLPEPWCELPAYISRVLMLWYMNQEQSVVKDDAESRRGISVGS